MRISALAKESGTTTDLIRYLETKGFIRPKRLKLEKRIVRDYSEEEVELVKLIAKYIQEGFKHDVAYGKATDQLSNPRLL